MASTRRNLIDTVLDKLGVLVFGQAPSDEMVSRVDRLLDPAIALLASLEIAYVADVGTPSPPSGGEIEDAMFLPLANWVAFEVASGFGLGADPALKVLATEAEEIMLRQQRPAATRKTLTTDPQLRGRRGLAGTGNFSRGT